MSSDQETVYVAVLDHCRVQLSARFLCASQEGVDVVRIQVVFTKNMLYCGHSTYVLDEDWEESDRMVLSTAARHYCEVVAYPPERLCTLNCTMTVRYGSSRLLYSAIIVSYFRRSWLLLWHFFSHHLHLVNKMHALNVYTGVDPRDLGYSKVAKNDRVFSLVVTAEQNLVLLSHILLGTNRREPSPPRNGTLTQMHSRLVKHATKT